MQQDTTIPAEYWILSWKIVSLKLIVESQLSRIWVLIVILWHKEVVKMVNVQRSSDKKQINVFYSACGFRDTAVPPPGVLHMSWNCAKKLEERAEMSCKYIMKDLKS